MNSQPVETPDQRAERLLRVGLDVACRLREGEDPAELRAQVRALLADEEVLDLAVLLAAGIDVERPVSEIYAWRDEPRRVPYALTPSDAINAALAGRDVALTPADRVEVVRILAGRGYTDPQIAACVRLRPDSVKKIRLRHRIPSGRRIGRAA